MSVPLKEEGVLKDFIGFGKDLFHVAEFQRHEFRNVSLFTVFVDARLRSCEGFFGIGDRRQDFIVDIDQVEGLEGGQLFASEDGGDGVSNVSRTIYAKGLLVLADGKNPVLDRQIFACQNQVDARASECSRRVDLSDARMRMRGPEQLAVRHAREKNVPRRRVDASYFCAGIDSAARNTDHAKRVSVGL